MFRRPPNDKSALAFYRAHPQYLNQETKEPPPVEVLPEMKELAEELRQTRHVCFAWITARYFLGEFTTGVYFDQLINHLRLGAGRHRWDRSRTKISHFLQADLIAGAFKVYMLDRIAKKLSDQEAARLKTLCILVYSTAPVDALKAKAEEVGAPLEALSPHIIQILAMIAYARRSVPLLQHLITYPSPNRTVFDTIGTPVLNSRSGQTMAFQHSPDTPENPVIEWKMWTALLQSKWIHYPIGSDQYGLHRGLQGLVRAFGGNPELRASPALVRFLETLGQKGIMLDASTISCYLSAKSGSDFEFPKGIVPISAAQTRMVLLSFPLSRGWGDNKQGKSADLLLPITQWGLDNSDRLEVMKMLLEEGADPNGRICDYDHPVAFHLRDPPLVKAAELGDVEMVKLLVKHGAKNSVKGGKQDTAAERARSNGHHEIAEWLGRHE